MADYEIDYKKMFEESQNTINSLFDMQHEFFDLLKYVNENIKFSSPIPDNIFKMNLPDQVLYLRAIKKNLEICKYLVKKYSFKVEEEETENEKT
jgi:hypothetical protein